VALSPKRRGIEQGFYWYVSGMIGLSLLVYVRMSKTRGSFAIHEEDVSSLDEARGRSTPVNRANSVNI